MASSEQVTADIMQAGYRLSDLRRFKKVISATVPLPLNNWVLYVPQDRLNDPRGAAYSELERGFRQFQDPIRDATDVFNWPRSLRSGRDKLKYSTYKEM